MLWFISAVGFPLSGMHRDLPWLAIEKMSDLSFSPGLKADPDYLATSSVCAAFAF